MRIDERLERLTERHEALSAKLKLLHHDIQDLSFAARRDGENIRALLRNAEIRARHLNHREGGE
jgi:hypothetical protein